MSSSENSDRCKLEDGRNTRLTFWAMAIGNQIFGVVGSSEFPLIWVFADSLVLQLAFVVLLPGILALVFGWLALRSRVTGV